MAQTIVQISPEILLGNIDLGIVVKPDELPSYEELPEDLQEGADKLLDRALTEAHHSRQRAAALRLGKAYTARREEQPEAF